MLIKGKQPAQCLWVCFLPADKAALSIASKMAMGLILIGRTHGQRFGLCYRIGNQPSVAWLPIQPQPQCAGGKRHQNINRAGFQPLMQILKKAMLGIGSGLTPNQRAGWQFQWRAMPVHRFAITLHFQLLRPCGQTVQMLIIGHNPIRGAIKEISVPDPH